MTIGQQWAIIFAIFWIGSVWYAYAMGNIRGKISARREARLIYEFKREKAE